MDSKEATSHQAYAEDLLVRSAGQEQVVLALFAVKDHAVRHLLVGELVLDLAGLRVPQLDHSVERGREKLSAVSVEGHVTNTLSVA